MSTNPTDTNLPVPPPDLLHRIGPMGVNPVEGYLGSGPIDRRQIEDLLPDDWSWTGKRVLDFGCGVARVLRQFEPEANETELWGCDIDSRSVTWNKENLEPPLHFFESTEEAKLPQDDGFFDLIYAFSVYTHLTDHWADWLLEHHRVLADGGYLIATFLGEGMLEPLTGENWDEDRIGFNPLMYGNPWDRGGPNTINSPWWIRAHWGRAFEIVELKPRRVEDGSPSHGIILARKKPVDLTTADLIAIEPDEPREIAALQHHGEQLGAELKRVREAHDRAAADVERMSGEVDAIRDSASWRLTAPLRTLKAQFRART